MLTCEANMLWMVVEQYDSTYMGIILESKFGGVNGFDHNWEGICRNERYPSCEGLNLAYKNLINTK